jgi:bacterial SH3 domain-containing protein
MDRTEASDAFNAGSIPVGCIYITLIIGREMREAACGFLQFKEYFRIRKGLYMWKEKIHSIGNYIIKHNKVVLPAVVVVAVAITVSVSLSLSNRHKEAQQEAEIASAASETATETATEDVPLVANEEGAIYTLIATYYNAMATGDEETLRSVCDEISDKDMYRYVELSQYIDYYPTLEIYTKTGPEEGSVIAYVYYKISFVGHEEEVPGYQALYICTNDQGGLYIKRGENSEEVNEYIKTVSTQDDVVEFNNKITVEYNELMVDHPEVLQYISELDSQVSIAVGEKLANQVAAETQVAEAGTEEGSTDGQDTQTENGEQQEAEDQGPQYVTTTTTVNVRSSDSEQADKLGKVSGGTKLQVLEQRPNGWTKVDYEGKEGYIKTEFLQLAESAAGTETIGTVTATTNINVRASASETADRLGVLSGGDSAELVGTEGDWSKIKYNGQIGYVKSEYVQ